ncbi:ferrochelatase [Terriglobus roseus]|uniref:Ferrochelatase n=1 Tax=Terriglobus roseus TaxID=392734 RepID=A0A1H4M746_9BACT|nr:ferrochelatase [Terriglobus roseus]SEB78920.1 ferrochelatase [Terriglobus roseus]
MIKDLPYFLIGLAAEKLNLEEQLNPNDRAPHASPPRHGSDASVGKEARILAQYEVSNADQIAAAMAAPEVKQPEPEHFDAILLLAHGTPDVLGEMDAYLKLVTGGRGVPPHVVHELQERYAEIGLRDEPTAEGPHLTRWTLLQGKLLQQRIGTPVYVGMRNWKPFIADTVAQMKDAGVKKIRAICLAPQNSRTSVGLYRRALEDAAAGAFEIDFVSGWSEHTLLVRAFAEKMRKAYETALATGGKTAILFTAHSVPCRTIQAKPSEHHGMMLTTDADTYAIECKATAKHIAEELSDILDEKDWYFCFQSQGLSGGPWIGPGVPDLLAALKQEGYTRAVLQPVGFLCDHVEILYDIDIDFQKVAAEIGGITVSRAESLNDSPTLIAALADLSRRGVRSLPTHPVQQPHVAAEILLTLAPVEEAQTVSA